MQVTKFSSDELELAQRLKSKGLLWEPAVGHYVLDLSQLIERASPFQDGVYFILDLKHFVRLSGTLDELKRRMCWLPDWDQARSILKLLGQSSTEIAHRLRVTTALEADRERLELYRMIEEHIPTGEHPAVGPA